jgi:CSLREA domain-containing protein
LALLAFGLLALAFVAAPSFVSAATYTVSKTADTNDGTCDADCSLREAVVAANANAGADTITFNIPNTDPGYIDNPPAGPGGDDYWRISVASALTINAANGAGTVVDGSTQTVNQGNTNTLGPEIEVRGSGAANIFVINNVGTITIRDLVINNATGAGVWITAGSATFNKLYGNYIGTNAAGTAAVANGAQGVLLDGGASNNDVGGPNAGEGNVISGNSTHGIQIGANANNNKIRGNKIGTNGLGTVALGNTTQGVQINGVPTSGTIVGGAAAGEGNIISGNGNDGIAIAGTGATDVTIYGNIIGTDAGGTINLGNGRYGVSMDSTVATANLKLGGVDSGQGNLIAYNTSHGARMLSTAGNGAGNEIKGNTIHNNTGNGIYVGTVSGPVIAKNLVRNNGGVSADGVRIAANATSVKVYHNTVHANAGDGISVEEIGATIKNNIITGNGAYGINRVAASMTESNNLVTDAATNPGNASGRSNVALDASDLNADPLYVNSGGGDFTLTECTSPADNVGVDLGADQPDMNGGGAGNYNSTAPDLGAYETGCGGMTVSGTVYTDEGVTNIGSGKTVRLVVNGRSANTATTNASGAYSIGTSLNSGDALLVYVDGDATYKGTTVTVSNGANLAGLNIYSGKSDGTGQAYLIVRHDNGGSLTNALMSTALGSYSDADIKYSVAGGQLTVSDFNTLYVPGGHTFAPGNNTFLDAVKLLGTLSAGSYTHRVRYNWDAGGGTYTAGTSTLYFYPRLGLTFTPGGSTYYNIDFDSYNRFNTLGGNVTVSSTFIHRSTDTFFAGTLTVGTRIITTQHFDWQSGYLAQAAGSGITCSGNFTRGATTGGYFSGNGAGLTITFSGAGNSVFTPGSATHGSVTINKTNPTDVVSLSTNNLVLAGSQSLTLTTGIFDLAGRNLDIGASSTFSNTGTLRLQGGETITNLTNDTDSGTVEYNGGGAYGSLVVGNSYYHLTFNGAGSWAHTAPLSVNGNFTLTAGTVNSGGQNVTVTGNWSNSGAYTSGANTVTLNGTNQSITGNTTFNHFTKSVASAATLTFAAGSTQTFNGTVTLNGASGQLLSLRSSSSPTRWNFNVAASATKAISYVDVMDSDASGSDISKKPIGPTNATDSGNTVDWFNLAISGTVYTDEGVTNIGAGKTVRLIINGASAGTAVTDGSGVYSITPGSLSAGDAILVYIDGDATYLGTTVSISNGSGLSGFHIYAAHLIARQDNAGSLTNANMSTAKGAYVDTDILYSVSAGNLTVSGSGTELYVPTGHSFAPGGNVTTPNLESKGTFNGGSGAIDINGALVVSGGSFTATSGTTNVGGNYTLSAGTFTHNNGTVTFDGTSGTILITPGGQSFYNITFNDAAGTATYQLQGALTVANDLTVTDGILDTKSGSNYAVNVTRDFIQSGGQVKAQGSTITVGRDFTAYAGEANPGSSTNWNAASLVLTGAGGLTYSGLASDWQNGFNNLTVAQSGNTTTLNNTIAVLGMLAVGSGTFTGPGAQSVYLRKQTSTPPLGSPFDFTNVTAATRISVPYLKMYGTWDQELPPIPNGRGYDSNIAIAIDSGGGATVTQTGDITIVAPKSFRMVGDGSANRVQNYNTAGFALNVGGDFVLGWGSDTGTKTFNATNSTITVGGNIDIRTGTNVFTNTNSTVILNGAAAQTVLMNGKNFNNLTITNASAAGVQFLDGFSAANFTDTTAASKLTFKAGATYTVSGTLTLTGTIGNEIVLLSDSTPTRFTLNVTGSSQTVSYVNVKDSQTQSGVNNITANNSINSGGNDDAEAIPHWIFSATISGTVYTDEGVTNIGAGKTIRLLVNGASVGTGVTDGSGNYSVTAGFNPGDALLAFIDGNDGTTTDGTTVTVTHGGALAGLNLYVDHLLTRHDNGGSLTNALMNTAKGAYSDSEILYSVSAGNLTVSGTGTELYIPAGHSFAPGGDVTTPNLESLGTFNGGSGAIDINGALLINGGSFTATSGTTFISGNFTLTAGSFVHNAGLITFDSVGTKTVDIGTTNLNNVTLNMTTGTDLAVTGTMNVNGNLTLTTLGSITSGTIAVSGNVLTTDASVSGAGVILFTGSGTQTLSAGGASGALPGVSINKSGGSLTIQDTIEIDGSSGWSYTAGAVVTTGSTVDFQGGSKTVDSGAMSFNNVIITLGGSSLTVTGTMDVNGNLTIASVNGIDTGTIAVAGNATTTDAAVSGTGRILFDGGGAQTLQVDGAGGTGGVPAVQINKGGGTLTIKDVISVGGFGAIEEWEHLAGTVDAGTSTILFDFGTKTITPGSMTFNNVIINTGGSSLTVTAGTMDINANLTITTTSSIAGAITVAGNLSSADTTVIGTGTITLDGAGAQTIDTTGGGDLPNGTLTINKASGTATLASNLTLNGAGQDLTITQGALDLAGFNLTLTAAGDVLTVDANGALRLQGGEIITASTKTFNAGSTVIYNGAGAYGSLAAGNNYHHLTFNGAGSWTHTSALDVNGNLTITSGTLSSGGQNVNVAGNWSNSGTYTSGANTVTLDGTNQSINGSTTFNNLTKSVASAATLTFAASSTTTVNGAATLNGASGQLLSLRSGAPGTRWNFNLGASATKAISYVDVQDSDASGSAAGQKMINPANSFDSGNNIDWFSLALVKQVWQAGGSTPLAKSNGAPSSTTVPSGETVVFLIYVKNPNLSAVSDIRFSDLLDVSASGFDYVVGSLVRDDGSLSDAATDLAIFNATAPGTGVALTDAADGDVGSACTIATGLCPGAAADRVTAGNTTGLTPAQANGTLSIPANKTFAVRFRAVKK